MNSAELFGSLNNYPYLCAIKTKAMEEKRYPQLDEEENTGMVSEPMLEPVADMVASMSKSADVLSDGDDWVDDLDWSRFPSLGPFSEEEAIARIEEAERELDDPSKWVSSEDAWAHLYQKYPWLR